MKRPWSARSQECFLCSCPSRLAFASARVLFSFPLRAVCTFTITLCNSLSSQLLKTGRGELLTRNSSVPSHWHSALTEASMLLSVSPSWPNWLVFLLIGSAVHFFGAHCSLAITTQEGAHAVWKCSPQLIEKLWVHGACSLRRPDGLTSQHDTHPGRCLMWFGAQNTTAFLLGALWAKSVCF